MASVASATSLFLKLNSSKHWILNYSISPSWAACSSIIYWSYWFRVLLINSFVTPNKMSDSSWLIKFKILLTLFFFIRVNFLNSFAAVIALMMKAKKRILFISKNKDTNPKNKLIFKELLIVAKFNYHKIEKKKNKF